MHILVLVDCHLLLVLNPILLFFQLSEIIIYTCLPDNICRQFLLIYRCHSISFQYGVQSIGVLGRRAFQFRK